MSDLIQRGVSKMILKPSHNRYSGWLALMTTLPFVMLSLEEIVSGRWETI